MSDRQTTVESHVRALAKLAHEAETDGPSAARLGAIVELASEAGALRALRKCGLNDEAAGDDIRELRNLLEAWRDARRTALRTMVRWITTLFILALMAGLASRLELPLIEN